MQLQFYEYTCECGCIFQEPDLIGSAYGHFILRSEIDELVYLNSFTVREFGELKKLLKNPRLKNLQDDPDIFQDLFSLICDLSPQKKIYFMQKLPNCPQCHSPYEIKNWSPVFPYKLIEMEIDAVSFNKWNELSGEEKMDLIDKGLESVLKKFQEYDEYMNILAPIWTKLSEEKKIKEDKKIAE